MTSKKSASFAGLDLPRQVRAILMMLVCEQVRWGCWFGLGIDAMYWSCYSGKYRVPHPSRGLKMRDFMKAKSSNKISRPLIWLHIVAPPSLFCFGFNQLVWSRRTIDCQSLSISTSGYTGVLKSYFSIPLGYIQSWASITYLIFYYTRDIPVQVTWQTLWTSLILLVLASILPISTECPFSTSETRLMDWVSC
jgi:hypothetical protein